MGGAMLTRAGKDQLEALERAAECRRKADAAHYSDVREGYFDMEQRWLRLAESYTLLARLQKLAGSNIEQHPHN